MFDYLAVCVEAKDVNASGLLASPSQITNVDKSQITIDGDAFYLTRYSPRPLDVSQNSVETIREERIVLDVRPGHKIWIQVESALVENLGVDNVYYPLNMLF